VAVDEFTNRLRLAVAGALASVSPTAAAAAPADDLDRGQFVERAANLVAKVERTEPDAALWLPFLAALVSVGGVLAIAASVRRVLAPTTLAAVLALSASPTSNASGLSPTPTPPPLSPRSMSTGASLPMSPTGATSPPVSVDESRLQRYARVERADRVRQSYVAVLKAVLKDWRLLPRSPLASLLLLCDSPNGALVRDVLLQLARDDSAAFWQALVGGIDPLLVERRRLPESARSSSSAGDATPVRRYSIDADNEALVRTTSPVIRTTSPLARVDDGTTLARQQSATPPITADADDNGVIATTTTTTSSGGDSVMAALFVALMAWRRAIDDDDEAARARLGDAMMASAFLEHTWRSQDLSAIEPSEALAFVLRQLRVVAVSFATVAMSESLTSVHVEFFFEIWRASKRVGVASGGLTTVAARDSDRHESEDDESDESDDAADDDDDSVDGKNNTTAEGNNAAATRAAGVASMQRYRGKVFWSAFIALTSQLHAVFPWHVQRALCDMTPTSAGVAYRITSALRCNPLLAVVTHDTEMPPTAEAIQRLGNVREFERFAASLIVSAPDDDADAGAARVYDEHDVYGALEFERTQKRVHLAARLRAEVSSRSARLALAAERLLDVDYAHQLSELKNLFAAQQQAQREMVAKKDAWTSKLQTRIENLITINNRLTEQGKQATIEASAYKEQAEERHTKLREAADRLVRARIEADDRTLQLNEAREQLQVLLGLVLDLQSREQQQQQLRVIGDGVAMAAADVAAPCALCASTGAQLAAAERRAADAEDRRRLAEQRVAELTAAQQRFTLERDAARLQYEKLAATLERERRAASDQSAQQHESRTALSERVLELSEQVSSAKAAAAAAVAAQQTRSLQR
jgi:hypothetical protein